MNEKDAIGCKNSRHVPDMKTNAIINRFAAATPLQQQPSSAPAVRDLRGLLIDLDSDEDTKEGLAQEEVAEEEPALSKEMLVFQKFHARPSDENKVVEQDGERGKTVRHIVVSTDTLAGLAVKYGVKAADIKRANNLLGDSIFERKHLEIPNPSRIPNVEELQGQVPKCGKEQIAITRFMNTAKCCKQEALYYLVDNDYQLDKALSVFFEDEEWARTHPFKPRAVQHK